MSTLFKTALLAGAVGLMLATPARAQEGYAYSAYSNDPESVTVIAPPYRSEKPMKGFDIPGKTKLSMVVNFADLNLATKHGQRVLQRRIQESAHSICDQLIDAYGPEIKAGSCYREAESNAMAKVQFAINAALYGYRYERY